MHHAELKAQVRQAIANVASAYGDAHVMHRRADHTKIAVEVNAKRYTLEYDQSPVVAFLPIAPELCFHGDWVTTIKVPRSKHGRNLAHAAALLGLVADGMLLACTTNQSWPGSRIRFGRQFWREREYSAIRYSDWSSTVQYLNIPQSICAQVINAYDRSAFLQRAEAERWFLPYRAGLLSRELERRGRR